jgi:hypothetical protein
MAPDEDGVYRLSAAGSLSVSFTLPAGAPPQAFPIAARFTGPDLDEVLPVAGHSELHLRPFDATTGALTRRPQLHSRAPVSPVGASLAAPGDRGWTESRFKGPL